MSSNRLHLDIDGTLAQLLIEKEVIDRVTLASVLEEVEAAVTRVPSGRAATVALTVCRSAVLV